MIYGYLRVSSDDQDVNSQKQGVINFAKEKGWSIDKYITDEGVSGGKDPDKRNLGPLLKIIKKDDIIISSEISRLGRDLYMVMDILHFCMEQGCVIYTVKDRFILGNDIQSKVLAFAFGLSAEIERQMIRQRTKEGLRLRMKMGILLGRPIGSKSTDSRVIRLLKEKKEEIITAVKWGASQREISKRLNIDRNTFARHLYEWGIFKKLDPKGYEDYLERKRQRNRQLKLAYAYKDTPPCIVTLPYERVESLILANKTIPEIHKELPQFTYEQLYDSIQMDTVLNSLYRKHAQLKLVKKR